MKCSNSIELKTKCSNNIVRESFQVEEHECSSGGFYYNFQDGNGPVPAHRHPNGGGWVADSAYVAETAYIGPNAQVFGKARICDNARIFGNAQVSGNTWVYGNAQFHGYDHISGNEEVYET